MMMMMMMMMIVILGKVWSAWEAKFSNSEAPAFLLTTCAEIIPLLGNFIAKLCCLKFYPQPWISNYANNNDIVDNDDQFLEVDREEKFTFGRNRKYDKKWRTAFGRSRMSTESKIVLSAENETETESRLYPNPKQYE